MDSAIEVKPVEVEMKPVENMEGENTSSDMKQTNSPVTNDVEAKDIEMVDNMNKSEKTEEDYVPEETMNSFGVFLFFLSYFNVKLAMNIMKGIAGTGCLALPIAVKSVFIYHLELVNRWVFCGQLLYSF